MSKVRFFTQATTLMLAGLVTAQTVYAQARIPPQTLIDWGLEVYGLAVDELKVPGSALFAETASLSGTRSGGAGGFAYVWPASIQFRVLNSLTQLNPTVYAPVQQAFANELHTRYWRVQAPRGYRSGVPSSADLFYDDNAHIAVALLDAYSLTGESVYLSRARATIDFCLTGEDSVGGGGIYFNEVDFSFKDAISTMQTARAGAMLFRATGDERYLTAANRLYDWAADTLQRSNGLFWEKLYLTGSKAGTLGDNTIVNSAGIGLSTNLELYKATGDPAYVVEAQRIADISVRSYFQSSTGRINDEGFWAFELVDGLLDLYELDGNLRWVVAVERGLEWLHEHKRDANGHYGLFWGREGDQTTVLTSWNLIDQAPVARAYLSLALVDRVQTGDFNRDGVVDGADFLQWQREFGTAGAPGLGADGNRDGLINATDLAIWKSRYGADLAAVVAVPEPTGCVTMTALAIGAFLLRRRGG
jgi:hypothetical protein